MVMPAPLNVYRRIDVLRHPGPEYGRDGFVGPWSDYGTRLHLSRSSPTAGTRETVPRVQSAYRELWSFREVLVQDGGIAALPVGCVAFFHAVKGWGEFTVRRAPLLLGFDDSAR